MLTCNEVTRLVASDAIRSGGLMTRIRVRMHLLACRHCRRYVRELAQIGNAVRDLVRQGDDRARDEAVLQRVLRASGPPPT